MGLGKELAAPVGEQVPAGLFGKEGGSSKAAGAQDGGAAWGGGQQDVGADDARRQPPRGERGCR